MEVSWNWLNDYVAPQETLEKITDRLTNSGLNHESTKSVGSDYCIDLEVTSNRPDCLGHLGIAREIAILTGQPLKIPQVRFPEQGSPISEHCSVRIDSPALCQRYVARLVRGVQVGPSPSWLAERLVTLGISPVNNIVDISNYVMLECGQPLHTFDFSKISGGKIEVREARPGENLMAINHVAYPLEAGMCVIADRDRPIAIAGVMGGAETEITESSRDVLIEAAWFTPGCIRATARKLNLHSASSFRFERNTDLQQLDWASRRCAQLIVEIAGGVAAPGVIDENQGVDDRPPITLRKEQLKRILGIAIPESFVESVLSGLGMDLLDQSPLAWTVRAPTWRRDLTREIDLIEEVGRIFGYDQIPDNVSVPMTSSHPTPRQKMVGRIRKTLSAAGFDEAMCPSLLPELWSNACSPWTDSAPLTSQQPMLGVLEKGAQNVGAVNCLRRSLIPSLLEAKRINEYRSNSPIELYEIAHAYLPRIDRLPDEPWMLSLVSGRDFFEIKGVLEAIFQELNPGLELDFQASPLEILDVSQSAQVLCDGSIVGHLGVVAPKGRKLFGLRMPTTVAELNLSLLESRFLEIHRYWPLSEYPSVKRDLNFVVDDSVAWAQLEKTVREYGGAWLEKIQFRETFRDEGRDGRGKKRLLLSLQWRSNEMTLSSADIDAACESIVQACLQAHGGVLVS